MGSPDPDPEDGARELAADRDYQPPPALPRAPDGGPVLPPQVDLEPTPAGQGLCSDGPGGPCARYHRLECSIDAQAPIAKVVGAVDDPEHLELAPDDGAAGPGARQVIHTCYPAPGREIDLGNHHVFACNLYVPATDLVRPSSVPPYSLPSVPPSVPPPAAPRSAREPRKRRAGRR